VKTLEVTLAGTWDEIARIPAMLAELADGERLSAATRADIGIALDEILSNIVKYAHPPGQVPEIRLRLTLTDDRFVAEVSDDGRAFDPLSIPPPDRSGSLATRKVGGLGIHFVRNLASELRYRRVADRNHLVLAIRVKAGEQDA
jgi:serine/threonine-protein kinase RsbW